MSRKTETELALIEKLELYTIEIEKMLIGTDDIYDVLNQIPHGAHISHPETFQLLHTNRMHEQITCYAEEEVRENWDEYIKRLHPDTMSSLDQILPEFYSKKEKHATISFMQYGKLYRKEDYLPLLTFSKVSTLPGEVKLWIYLDATKLGNNVRGIDRIVEMDEFKLKNFRRFQTLTAREVEVLTLMAQGLNNPKIAEQLFLSRSTIETHRKNLKKKLELKSYRDVMRYALAFDLIHF